MEYTEREIQLTLTLLLRGKSDKYIADKTGLSVQDVQTIANNQI